MYSGIPFWKIKRKSRIVFYGCGRNSSVCYKQLIENGYCVFAGVVDRNPKGKSLDGNMAQSIEKLKDLHYDAILITIVNEKIVQSVKEEMLNNGVPLEKINTLFDLDQALSIEQLKLNNYFENYMEQTYQTRKSCARKSCEYYSGLQALFAEQNDFDELFVELKKIITKTPNNDKKLILLSLMYQNNYFDSACLKELMTCLKEMEWKDDTCYGIIIDTNYVSFLHMDYIYPEFYSDRKVLYKKICRYYELSNDSIKRRKSGKKIAIVANSFSPNMLTDAVSMMIKTYAKAFVKLDYEVCIFVLFSKIESDIHDIFIERYYGFSQKEDAIDYSKEEYQLENIQIMDEFKTNVKERLQNTLTKITEYDPEFIIDMSDETFPEADVLIQRFPIICFPMRCNAYTVKADAYLAFSDIQRIINDNRVYHALQEEQLYELKLGNIGEEDANKTEYCRKQFGFKDEDFLIVTVGSRLNIDLSDEFIQEISTLLFKKKNFKWILVGDKLCRDNREMQQLIEKGQIIYWGYEKNLGSLYRICNVYLNPNRIGGGVSIRMAMKNALPVVMTDFPTAMRDQVNPNHIVHGGYRELMSRVLELSENQKLYQKVKEETIKQIGNVSSLDDAKKVLRVCQEVANERKGKIFDCV